jgi:hypothetical protein
MRRAYCAVLAVPAPEMARSVPRRRWIWSHRADDLWQSFAEDSPTLYG